ncbi:MAG: hypothetical protein JXR76_19325 [Deltaproteobacteria bacterium]|nr:hypothetical protein [Deltaproteobacteria bacterium]
MKRTKIIVFIILIAFLAGVILFSRVIAPTRWTPQIVNKVWHRLDRSIPRRFAHPNPEIVEKVEQYYSVRLSPAVEYGYVTLENGVYQSLDMPFTYDYIPNAIKGGVLFQSYHAFPLGTEVTINVKTPGRLYFIFHRDSHGGYNRIFPQLTEWTKSDDAPRYDINNGDHGLHMVMYELKTAGGKYRIPKTTQKDACFSIVFKGNKPS